MAFTDDVITASSQLSVTDGLNGPVFAQLLPAAGKGYVTGKLGVGTINPANMLDVEGALVVGAGYSGSVTAPANSLLVEGSMGLGTPTPGAKLDVTGSMRVTQDAQLLGKVGIGIAAPKNVLDVKGAMAVGALFAGANTAPANGLLVEGSMGLGTPTPGAKLDIEGGAFLGYETSIPDFGAVLKSGFYQNSGAKIPGDVPDPASGWTHVITARHSNTSNNYQLQIAASYTTNDKLYFRKIAANGAANPAWNELATRGGNTFSADQTIQATLTVGTNPLRFTSAWSGFAASTPNQAEISNDTGTYKTLMLVGNPSAGMGRRVSVWDRLEVNGDIAITNSLTVGANPVRFTSGWSGFPDAATNQAEISNDTGSYQTLMIVGNKSAGIGRRVSIWDRLEVNGQLAYTGTQNKLDVADNFTAIVRAADLWLGHSSRRGTPGRALVDWKDANGVNTLHLNWDGDWSGGARYWVSWARASSRRLKDNIVDLSSDTARRVIERLNPVSFYMKNDERKTRCLGFIAEDVPPEVGTADREAVNTDHIVAALTRVVKDQQQAIAELRRRIEQLGRQGRL